MGYTSGQATHPRLVGQHKLDLMDLKRVMERDRDSDTVGLREWEKGTEGGKEGQREKAREGESKGRREGGKGLRGEGNGGKQNTRSWMSRQVGVDLKKLWEGHE